MSRSPWLLLAFAVAACEAEPRARDAGGEDAAVSIDPPALRAGAVTVDITPEPPVRIVGFGERTATRVRDPLAATVLVVRSADTAVAVVAIDLPGIFAWRASQLRSRVATAAAVPYEHVIVAASHTHSAPMLGDDPWSEAAAAAVERAAREAAADLALVRVRFGEDRQGFCVNRRRLVDGVVQARPNPEGPDDPRVRALAFERPDGSTVAVVAHATCHPNVLLGVDSPRVSADYPGEARRRFARAPLLFLNGASGDVRPLVVDDDGAFRLGTDADLARIGAALHDAVERALANGTPFDGPLDADRTLVALPRRAPEGATLDAELSAVRLGDLRLVTVPGEPFVEVGLAVEAGLRERIPDAHVIVTGTANGYVDYLVTPSAERLGGYEVERSRVTAVGTAHLQDELVSLGASLR
ncbi:MAG TPA: hypothetical protein RMH99_28805 [Sandaracinaceae bacterium LLY-WYZ-13_1]|nr:hypothetical protein [Sandaracinaceae bacterium LLY-WYZ-13_1]